MGALRAAAGCRPLPDHAWLLPGYDEKFMWWLLVVVWISPAILFCGDGPFFFFFCNDVLTHHTALGRFDERLEDDIRDLKACLSTIFSEWGISSNIKEEYIHEM